MKEEQISSEELIQLAQRGDDSAINELLERCRPAVSGYLKRRVGQKLRAYISISDLEQEVLIRGVQALERLEDGADIEAFKALLFLHARWSIGHAARARNRGTPLADGAAVENMEDTPPKDTGVVTDHDEFEWFEARLARLPEELRAIVRLRGEEKTWPEIGKEVNLHPQTARRRFLEAARLLQVAHSDTLDRAEEEG